MLKKLVYLFVIIYAFSTVQPQISADDYQHKKLWNDLIAAVNQEILEFPGKVGLALTDLTHDVSYTYNADHLMKSASIIKLPIMVAVFKEFNDGKISFTERYELTDAHRVGGSGKLKYAETGSWYTIYELVYIMISESDNTAAKMLTDIIGFSRMNEIFKSIGLTSTNISPQSFNLDDGEIAGESYTTVRDIAQVLTRIYGEELFQRYLSKQMIAILKMTVDRKRLNKFLPDDFELAHKTGLLRGACHDAGIVFSPHGDMLLCVMTDNNGNYRQAKEFIAHIGDITYRWLEQFK
ncbi:MAG: hypothetical protein GF384_07575 [Elusimicrobia bacterium]|nr:hypothetical protein [Elusimicrobiota bacterium]MBD3412510.1 hypothetical protein [Elusimicrobiota bacterium]